MTHPDIHFELRGDHQEVAVIRLTRAPKRNALNDGLILALRDLFEKMPSTVRAAACSPSRCAWRQAAPSRPARRAPTPAASAA